jgi:hypothetical protein
MTDTAPITDERLKRLIAQYGRLTFLPAVARDTPGREFRASVANAFEGIVMRLARVEAERARYKAALQDVLSQIEPDVSINRCFQCGAVRKWETIEESDGVIAHKDDCPVVAARTALQEPADG